MSKSLSFSVAPYSRIHRLIRRSHSFTPRSDPPLKHKKSPSFQLKTTVRTVFQSPPLSRWILSWYPERTSWSMKLSSEQPITTKVPDSLEAMHVAQVLLLLYGEATYFTRYLSYSSGPEQWGIYFPEEKTPWWCEFRFRLKSQTILSSFRSLTRNCPSSEIEKSRLLL